MRSVTLIACLPALATALPTTSTEAYKAARALVARAPPEAKAVLKSVTSSGTGCSTNSGGFIFKDDATIAFDSMLVESTMTNPSTHCLITIDLGLDSKWKYTINKATNIRGYVDGGNAVYKVTYTAGGKTSEVSGTVKPTSDGNWAASSTSAGATSAYGGGVAGIDVTLKLNTEPGKVAAVTIDTMDVKFDYSK